MSIVGIGFFNHAANPRSLSFPAEITHQIFRIGDQVRLSQLGADRMKKAPSKAGRVVDAAQTSKLAVRVLFDGMKSPVSLHQSYLELDDEG